MSALLDEVTGVLTEMGLAYSFPFGEEVEVVCLHPRTEGLVYAVSIHVEEELSVVNVVGRAQCFVPQRRRAAAEALLKVYREQREVELFLDKADGQLVVQRLVVVGDAGLSREMLVEALGEVHRAVMAHYDTLRRLQRGRLASFAAHLKRNGLRWASGAMVAGLVAFWGHWALNQGKMPEKPKAESSSVGTNVPLFVPPFQELKEEGMCTAAEKLAEKLLELQTQKYAELTDLLRAVQDAESAKAAVGRCAVLLRDADNIETVLFRCRLTPQAQKRVEAVLLRYRKSRDEYYTVRSRVLKAASGDFAADELVGFLNGKNWGYPHYIPEDLDRLIQDTQVYLEKVNEELQAVMAGKDSYEQAAAAFAERRAVPDDATLNLVLRWANAGRRDIPQEKTENFLREFVLDKLTYAGTCISYGEAMEHLLYLRRVRWVSGEYLPLKDWVDTYADMLLPLKLMLEDARNVPALVLRLDYLICLYDTLLKQCEALPQDTTSEKTPEEIKRLYGQILYQRMLVDDCMEVSSPHESCLVRLLLHRMKQFAAYSEDKRVELASMAIDTRDVLWEYELFKVFDNVAPEDAVPPMPLMMQMLYAEQLSHAQRALELLRDICDKKSADVAAQACSEAIRKRRICSVLRSVLSLSPEELAEVMTEVGNDAEMWTAALDAELARFRESPAAGRGSEKLAEVLSGVAEPAVKDDELENLLATTEQLLSYMVWYLESESEPSPATFHRSYFYMVAPLAQRWMRLEYLQTPLSREQLEMYEYGMERMVSMLKPFVQHYMKFDEMADSLGTCARLLPPVRKAIAVEMGAEGAHITKTKAAAEEVLVMVQQVVNVESAREILPKLRQAAEAFRSLQIEYLEVFSSADALMWPEILQLRLLRHEFMQAADALRAADNCYGCVELAQVLKDIALNWIPNLSAKHKTIQAL
ncbi:MAG: hypothetical protein IJ498_06540 [Akkermansia sp.]|nr:hypothetical protein [Akkermansia sp.]